MTVGQRRIVAVLMRPKTPISKGRFADRRWAAFGDPKKAG